MARWKSKAEKTRESIRSRLWPARDGLTWPPATGHGGWFKAPRCLPLLLKILKFKSVSDDKDPGRAYVQLLSEAWDDSVVVMRDEGDHAELAGYDRRRGIRTWRERVRLLAKLGFVEVEPAGEREFGYVLLRDPYLVVEQLHRDGLIDRAMFNLFDAKWTEAGAPRPKKEDAA